MYRCVTWSLVLALGVAPPALAADDGTVHASYDTYALGLHVADVQAGFGLGPWSYQVQLVYRTTGLVGVFYAGHQINTVHGSWQDDEPAPVEFFGDGFWRGRHRVTLVDYADGQPEVRELQPPNEAERQPVPRHLQTHTIDTLSALAELMRHVADSGRCETTVHSYDGRRLVEVTARTVGMETLEPDSHSVFSGPALRCDFEGRMLAGFMLGDSDEAHRRPLHGTAWMAQAVPGMPPMPVRMVFQTDWFGDATMYMTHAGPGELTLQNEN